MSAAALTTSKILARAAEDLAATGGVVIRDPQAAAYVLVVYNYVRRRYPRLSHDDAGIIALLAAACEVGA